MTISIPRHVIEINGQPDDSSRANTELKPLASHRGVYAYVLLGDPGLGKTTSFIEEANAEGLEIIRARDFIALPQTSEQWQGKTIFIDGLDETRAGGSDGRTVLDAIRCKLNDLGVPRFRLSCREQDWLGDSDRGALEAIVKETAPLKVFRLMPLTAQEIKTLLVENHAVIDPVAFIREAEKLGLDGVLDNPQTLRVLAAAVGNGERWPQTRPEAFELACEHLTTEINAEHKSAKRKNLPSKHALLDAAGYLSAIYLCANRSEISAIEVASKEVLSIQALENAEQLPIRECLETNLFVAIGNDAARPTHRSIAEYLGARYIAKRIQKDLSQSRAIALMTGADGGVITSLRGLHAWLAACCPSARSSMIERDPLGVLLYGDAQSFATSEKKLMLRCLQQTLERNIYARHDLWQSNGFAALTTVDMSEELQGILLSPGRERSEQSLADIVVTALSVGRAVDGIAPVLLKVASDASRLSGMRRFALSAYLRKYQSTPNEALVFLDDISNGKIEDPDDELLGVLLRNLYPKHLTVQQALGHLHNPKNKRLLGNYELLWRSEFLEKTDTNQLPTLLDTLAARPPLPNNIENDGYWSLARPALTRGLDEWGDHVDDHRLYRWLGIPLGEHDYDHLNRPEKDAVLDWLKTRPLRHKALLKVALENLSADDRLWKAFRHTHEAPTPPEFFDFFLALAASENREVLANDLFAQAVSQIRSDASLDVLQAWVDAHPCFANLHQNLLYSEINEWRAEEADRKAERRKEDADRVSQFAEVLNTQPPETLNVQGLYHLALAYKGLHWGSKGESPIDRLKNFLNYDSGLVLSALAALWATPKRTDLPTAAQVLDTHLNKKEWLLSAPLLVGLEALYERSEPTEILDLPEATLKTGVMVSFVRATGKDMLWRDFLAAQRPEMVARIFIEYAVTALKSGDRSLNGAREMATNEKYAAAARIAIPEVLDKFPRRANVDQLFDLERLIKGWLSFAPKEMALAVVRSKLELKTLDVGQRTSWLGAALLLEPSQYEKKTRAYVANNEVRIGHLSRFLEQRNERIDLIAGLPVSSLALLVELFGPNCRPERPTGAIYSVTPDMNRADLVNGWINRLSQSPTSEAGNALRTLRALPALQPWHTSMDHAIAAQTIVLRDASYHFPSERDVETTLAKGRPANAADLFAIVNDELRLLIADIERSDLDTYKQFWNVDSHNRPQPSKSNPEEACRNVLARELRGRLSKYGVSCEPEAQRPDQKRSDLWCGFDNYGIPVEAKKESHGELWTALQNQLIEKYSTDVRARGYGIYLIFWFGEKLKPPPSGTKPKTASELQARLMQLIPDGQRVFISVHVVDVSPRASARMGLHRT